MNRTSRRSIVTNVDASRALAQAGEGHGVGLRGDVLVEGADARGRAALERVLGERRKASRTETLRAFREYLQARTYLDGPGAEHWRPMNGEREVQTWLEIVFRSNALHAQRALAVAGKGVELPPTSLVTDEVRRRALRIVLPRWSAGPVKVNAIHRVEQRGAPRIRVLVDHLRSVYARTDG